MNKFLKVILILFLISIIVLGVGGFYLYNFYVFKTMRICVSDKAEDSNIPCASNNECIDGFLDQTKEQMDGSPEFMLSMYNEAIYCDGSCRVKEIYGFGEEIDSCKGNDREFVIEIKGKEAVEFLKVLKDNPEVREEVRAQIGI